MGGGSATCAVTKHAVVALSEALYLALERRKSLVKASVLCPGLVRTNIDTIERTRPESLRNDPVPLTPEMEAGLAAFKARLAVATPPEKVADIVFDSIRNEQFYIVTHPEWMEIVRMRTDQLVQVENPVDPTPAVMKLWNLL